jgi:hypothetical protein
LDEAATAQGFTAQDVDPPAAFAARLAEYRHRRRTLFDWMHPLRLAGLPFGEYLRGAGAVEAANLAEAFLHESGMCMPPLSSFGAPGAALVQLPAHQCLAVFRLRVLLDYRDEVRTWIDRPRRARLNEWVGPSGASLLVAQRRELGRDPMAPTMLSQLGSADADTLAWCGYRLFEREFNWKPNGPLALMQLAMPQADECALPLDQPAAHGRSLAHFIVSQLPDLFPEGAW